MTQSTETPMDKFLKGQIALAAMTFYFTQTLDKYDRQDEKKREKFLSNFLGNNDFTQSCALLNISEENIRIFLSGLRPYIPEDEIKSFILPEGSLQGETALTIIVKQFSIVVGLITPERKLNLPSFVTNFVGCFRQTKYTDEQVMTFLKEVFKEVGIYDIPEPKKRFPPTVDGILL